MIIKSNVGFSVEWESGDYIRQEDYNNLPCYELKGGKITAIAIVNEPAIDEYVVYDSNEEKNIVGVVMIADKKIFRTDDNKEYYVYFSAETIKKLQQNYKDNGLKIGH